VTSVTVLGLGNMGTALVRALVGDGHAVTVWNRSPKPPSSVPNPVHWATNAADACHASDVTIACLSSYDSTREVLGLPGVRETLAGRTLVQLSTGIPQFGVDLSRWAGLHGIDYLDGKIAVVPRSIGAKDTVIFYAGRSVSFEKHRPMLLSLGGKPTYVGEDAGRSALADFAFLSFFFGSTLGLLYGAAFSKAAGLDVRQFFDLAPAFAGDILGRIPSFLHLTESGDYANGIESTLNVDMKGAKLLAATALEAGLGPQLPDFLSACFDEAVNRGHGHLDTAALIDIFRGKL
jgi:3-hydroxyisobutyrate dehydrogenase-like beta-hydroxyacid dehydrogenase